jgi:hypothetical protein
MFRGKLGATRHQEPQMLNAFVNLELNSYASPEITAWMDSNSEVDVYVNPELDASKKNTPVLGKGHSDQRTILTRSFANAQSPVIVVPLPAAPKGTLDISLLPGWPEVKDQGIFGTCVSVTLANIAQWLRKDVGQPSSVFLHFNAKARIMGCRIFKIDNSNINQIEIADDDNTPYSIYAGSASDLALVTAAQTANLDYLTGGVAIVAASAAIDVFGTVKESEFPYSSSLSPNLIDQSNAPPAASVYRNASISDTQCRKFETVGHELIAEIRSQIASNIPVIIVYDMYLNSATAATNPWSSTAGYLTVPTNNDVNIGTHCSLLCGYDDAQSSFIMQNTWGKQCGLYMKRGYYMVPYEYIVNNQLTYEHWVIGGPMRLRTVGTTVKLPTCTQPFVSPLLVPPIVQGYQFYAIDLLNHFEGADEFTVTSTANNVSIVNITKLYLYPKQRTKEYTVTVTAKNMAGQIQKSFYIIESH